MSTKTRNNPIQFLRFFREDNFLSFTEQIPKIFPDKKAKKKDFSRQFFKNCKTTKEL